jgi:hypothetical protein
MNANELTVLQKASNVPKRTQKVNALIAVLSLGLRPVTSSKSLRFWIPYVNSDSGEKLPIAEVRNADRVTGANRLKIT